MTTPVEALINNAAHSGFDGGPDVGLGKRGSVVDAATDHGDAAVAA